MILTEEQANEVWDVLIAHCGCGSEREKEDFVREAQLKHKPSLEFRFLGNLGFGGKIYLENHPRVSCYPEDETPERLFVIQETNVKLALVASGWLEEDMRAMGDCT